MRKFLLEKALVTVAVLVTLTSAFIYAGATATTKTISLPSVSGTNTYESVSRNTNYSYIRVRLNSLYPTTGGTDSYTTVLCGLYTPSMLNISKAFYSVNESTASYTYVYIKEGYLSVSPVKLSVQHSYSGNTKLLSANMTIEDMR